METTRWEANPPRPFEFGPYIGIVPTATTSDQRSPCSTDLVVTTLLDAVWSGQVAAPHRQPLGINTM